MASSVSENNSTSRQEPPRRRRRPAHSCVECRRRKVKCDRNQPCNHCSSRRRHATCIYTLSAAVGVGNVPPGSRLPPHPQDSHHISPPSFSTGSYAGSPETTDTSALRMFAGAKACLLPRGRPRDDLRQGSEVSSGASSSPAPEKETNDDDDVLRRLRKLERLLSTCNTGRPRRDEHSPAPILTLQDGRGYLSKNRVFGRSHWMNQVAQFQTLRLLLDDGSRNVAESDRVRTLRTEIRALLQKCKYLAKAAKVARPSRCFSCPDLNLSPPLRQVADVMTGLYLSRFESAFRILHVPSFGVEYETYWSNPAAAAATSAALQLKVQLVIAIGSSVYRGGGEEEANFRSLAAQWVYAAQTWLAGPLEKDRLTISGLQVFCLLILARQILSVGGDLIWISMGTLHRTAMQMGLHRDPKHFPKMSVLEAEVRRRLWATILELSVQSSLDSGMPPMVSFADFDTEPPANIDDDEVDERTKSLPRHAKTTATATSAQLVLLRSLRPRLEVIACMNGLRSEMLYDEVLVLSSEISDACRECDMLAATTAVQDADGRAAAAVGLTTFRHNLADYLLRRFLLPLHGPFADRARTNPLFCFSRKTSIDCAVGLISPEPDEDFAHLMRVGGGVIRCTIRQAALSLGLELVAEVEADTSIASNGGGSGTSSSTTSTNGLLLRRRSTHREWLIDALKTALPLAAERILHGETNVQMHMLLSMVLGQVEAMEMGAPLELRVVERAKGSLEMSHGMLQARLGWTNGGGGGGGDKSVGCNKTNETDVTFLGREQPALIPADLTGTDFDFDFDDVLVDGDVLTDLFGPESGSMSEFG